MIFLILSFINSFECAFFWWCRWNIYGIFSLTEEIAHTPRDEVLVDIDDKEPLIPGQVWSVFLSAT